MCLFFSSQGTPIKPGNLQHNKYFLEKVTLERIDCEQSLAEMEIQHAKLIKSMPQKRKLLQELTAKQKRFATIVRKLSSTAQIANSISPSSLSSTQRFPSPRFTSPSPSKFQFLSSTPTFPSPRFTRPGPLYVPSQGSVNFRNKTPKNKDKLDSCTSASRNLNQQFDAVLQQFDEDTAGDDLIAQVSLDDAMKIVE